MASIRTALGVPFLAGLAVALVHAATAVPRAMYLHMPAVDLLRRWSLPAGWVPLTLAVVDLVVLSAVAAWILRSLTSLSWRRAFGAFVVGYLLGYAMYDRTAMGGTWSDVIQRLGSVFGLMVAALALSGAVFFIVLRRPQPPAPAES